MRSINRRHATNPTPREAIAFPVPTPAYHAYEEQDRWSRPPLREMWASRAFAPYQPGETMLVNLDGRVKLARVVRVDHETNRHDEFIPKWKVQLATKDGHWSQNWQHVYPGHVYRAHFVEDRDGKATPRDLPAQIDLGWLNRA